MCRLSLDTNLTLNKESIMKVVKSYSTVGLNTKIKGKVKLVQVCFDVLENDEVKVYAQSARNLAPIHAAGAKIITRQELSELPDDPYNDIVFAKAAFGLLGLEI